MPITLILMQLSVDASISNSCDYLSLLTGQEKSRARAIANLNLRRNYVLSHAAIHRLVRFRYICDGPNCLRITQAGRPIFDRGPHISLSRAGNWVAIALCPNQAIGIDLASTQSRASVDHTHKYPGLASRLQDLDGDPQLQFLRAWTELEAIAKLRQIPLEVLLKHPTSNSPVLTTYVNADLIVTIGCDSAEDIETEWASWSADGTLQTAPVFLRELPRVY